MSDTDPTLFDKIVDRRPYAGSSGHSGTDTSRARADHRDRSGLTGTTQTATIAYLADRGAFGATWKELANHLDVHHGSASGALSVLHREGYIARTTQRRNRCAVYVHLDWTAGLDLEEFTPNTQRNDAQAVAEALDAWCGGQGDWHTVADALLEWRQRMKRPVGAYPFPPARRDT